MDDEVKSRKQTCFPYFELERASLETYDQNYRVTYAPTSTPATLTVLTDDSKITQLFWGPLAQSVEHLPFKERVAGSNPARLTRFTN